MTAVGDRLSVVGYQLSAISYQLSEAAKRRKNTAHGASRGGSEQKVAPAPKGRKKRREEALGGALAPRQDE